MRVCEEYLRPLSTTDLRKAMVRLVDGTTHRRVAGQLELVSDEALGGQHQALGFMFNAELADALGIKGTLKLDDVKAPSFDELFANMTVVITTLQPENLDTFVSIMKGVIVSKYVVPDFIQSTLRRITTYDDLAQWVLQHSHQGWRRQRRRRQSPTQEGQTDSRCSEDQ